MFYGQRIARIARNCFVFITRWTWWTWWLAQCTVWLNLVHLVIIFQTFFVPFVLSVGKIIICCWINFCPRKSKHTNSYNFLIIIDIRCTIPIKSPKIHPKSLLLYIFFANFLSYPFLKLPNPNDIVSSINAYGVNNWHLVSYNGGKRAAMQCKTL